ncbi:coagulation factor V [Polyodon spathula]|uniref:coagulation factor V n=1 Tax=Polyodon spathula TaxID=7913 RepID=UPI001B7D9169|nr:coagulation factor V [Polyodon spathula]
MGTAAVKSCAGFLLFVLLYQSSLAVERHYYIAAVLTEWNYTTSEDQRSNSTYKKVVFREYNAGFKQAKDSLPWAGLLGPTLRAEVGDVMKVTFKNMADQHYSIQPNGIAYGKQSEGTLYFDNTSQFEKKDDSVHPGAEHEYIWEITEDIGPTLADPSCLTYTYYSHVNVVKDFNSGLIGALLICKKGSLDDDGKQKLFNQEFVLLFGIFDENKSWYKVEGSEPQAQPLYSINGYVNGSLPELNICAYDPVSWHLIGMSSEPELFSIHFNGQVLEHSGHKVSSVSLITASSTTANMTANHLGTWLMSSQLPRHLEAGMHGYMKVQVCEGIEAVKRKITIKERKMSQVWTYWIAAEERTWDYTPVMPTYIDREYKDTYLENGPHRIGRKYKKVVYVHYADGNFTTKVEGRKRETGILGPVIRAQIRDVVKVVFRNMATRPYSIYPQGLSISKNEEGANYPKDGRVNQEHEVKPGETHTYTWMITDEDEPTANDPRCLTRVYHSAVDMTRDIASGLIGPLLICKSQSLSIRNVQLKADKEQQAVLAVFDENKSWYLEDNIKTYCTEPSKVNREDPGFYKSNVMHTINGHIYDSGEFLGFCHNEVVTWHVSSVGSQDDIQTAHFYGHTFEHNKRDEDVLSLFPMSGETITMNMDNTGHWLLASLNSHQSNKGIRLRFKDLECLKDPDYYYENTDVDIVWIPGDQNEGDVKVEVKSKDIVSSELDEMTEMWASQLGLRSFKNKTQGLMAEDEVLDLSTLLGDYEETLDGNLTENVSFSASVAPSNTSFRAERNDCLLNDDVQHAVQLNEPQEGDLSVTGSSKDGADLSDVYMGNRSEKCAKTEDKAKDLQTLLLNSTSQWFTPKEVHNNDSVPLTIRNKTRSQEYKDPMLPPVANNTWQILNSDPESFVMQRNNQSASSHEEQEEESARTIENFTMENKPLEVHNNTALQSKKYAIPEDKEAFIYSVPITEELDNDSVVKTQKSNDADFVLLDSHRVNIVIDHILPMEVEGQPEIRESEVIYYTSSVKDTSINKTVPDGEGKMDADNEQDQILSSSITQDYLASEKHFQQPVTNYSHAEGQNVSHPVLTQEKSNHSAHVKQSLEVTNGNNGVRNYSIVSEWNTTFISAQNETSNRSNTTEYLQLENQNSFEAQDGILAGNFTAVIEVNGNMTEISALDNQSHSIESKNMSSESNETVWAGSDDSLNAATYLDLVNQSFSLASSPGPKTIIETLVVETHGNMTVISNDKSNNALQSRDGVDEVQIPMSDYKDIYSEEISSESNEMVEKVIIYLNDTTSNKNKISIGNTSLDPSKKHWEYLRKHTTHHKEIPSHVIKNIEDEKHIKTNESKEPPKQKKKLGGIKMRRKKKNNEKSLSATGNTKHTGFSPRGHRPNSMNPKAYKTVSNEKELIGKNIVIGVPRGEFNDYELFLPDMNENEDLLDLDQGNSYEYVEYKDPYVTTFHSQSNKDDIANHDMSMLQGNIRMYFIAAEEVDWDYDRYKGSRRFEEISTDKRNTQFKKVVFRKYLDSSFSKPDIRGEVDEFLGILGPLIKAEIDDNIVVVFRNLASREYSLHAHGVSFGKSMEGMGYEDDSPYWYKFDDAVQPGDTYTYVWQAKDKVGPKSTGCRTWVYYSGVNPEKDINSGLIGPLLICTKGMLNSSTFNTREFVLLFMTFDENKSWYFEDNMRKINNKVAVTDPEFKKRNRFHAINGIIYSLKGLRMYSNELVRWHLINMGGPKDIHSVHFHGQTFLDKQNKDYRLGVYPLVPGTFGTIEMRPSKPGLWLLESEVGAYQQAGMQTLFLVLDEDCEHPLGLTTQSVSDSHITAFKYRGEWKPKLARLHNKGYYNAWSAEPHPAGSNWIQVDFQRPVVISKVATQGAKNMFRSLYVTEYWVSYSTDSKRWVYYKGSSTSFRMTFEGNSDAYGIKENIFNPPIIGRFIRLYPTRFNGNPTLRMEFYGCELDGCSVPLGMENREIKNDQITASSSKNSWFSGTWEPNLARLGNEGSVNAWQAKANNIYQWLQVELQTKKKITGIVTQGAKSMKNEMYVKTFSIQYSNNGNNWTPYRENEGSPEKVS